MVQWLVAADIPTDARRPSPPPRAPARPVAPVSRTRLGRRVPSATVHPDHDPEAAPRPVPAATGLTAATWRRARRTRSHPRSGRSQTHLQGYVSGPETGLGRPG